MKGTHTAVVLGLGVGLICALATPASAGGFATSLSGVTLTSGTIDGDPSAPSHTAPSTLTWISGNVSAWDDMHAFQIDPQSGTATLTFRAAIAQNDGTLIIMMGDISAGLTVTIEDITFRTSGVGAQYEATTTGSFSAVTLSANTANRFTVLDTELTFGAAWTTLADGVVNFTGTMQIVGSGSIVQLDAIANPEPGTWALFGLGTLGLLGLAQRRRKKRLAKTDDA